MAELHILFFLRARIVSGDAFSGHSGRGATPGLGGKDFRRSGGRRCDRKKGSAFDGHARTDITSVCTAAEIFPILPRSFRPTARRLPMARNDWLS
jgi:hypothetical protein